MVAIKDMEMPRTCMACEFEDNGLMCIMLHWEYGDTEKVRSKGRLPDCPLIEVDDPEDGRL